VPTRYLIFAQCFSFGCRYSLNTWERTAQRQDRVSVTSIAIVGLSFRFSVSYDALESEAWINFVL